MYETYYDILKPYFGQQKFQLHCMDTDVFVLNVNTKDFVRELKSLEDIFDFSILDQNHELFSNKNKEVIGKFKIATPKNEWIDEFVCLWSKMFSLNVEIIVKIKWRVIPNLNQSILKLKNITIVYLVEDIRKNVINILFDQLILNCIFNE